MLTEICAELKNYFCTDADKHFGTFTIEGGTITPPFLTTSQYFRIVGSALNDGVYKYPATTLKDETFDGAIWAMRVPPTVAQLADDISTYQASDEAKPTGYTSESFGGYSYSKATGENGTAATWKDVFAGRLAPYRKVRV